MRGALRRLPLQLVALVLAAPAIAQDAAPVVDVAARIEALRAEAELPALAGAFVTVDGLQGVWATGKRRAGGEEAVAADDLWHLGSCTKSMTATLIALLVTRGDLTWDAILPDLLPDVAEEMNLDYLDVTLVDLLCHRAGLARDPPDEPMIDLVRGELSPAEQRKEFVRVALKAAPVHTPRGELLYSNAGFVIAGHVAEVATGKAWETLMQELLFQPLGMRSAGFGPPGSRDICDQPRGHTSDGRPVEPGPGADNPLVIGPAGTVHASLADWAKYVQLHLRGCRGDVKVGEITLTRETFARLHTAYAGPGAMKYGYGWGIEQRDWAGGDGTALWHNGSNGMWYCLTWLGLENGVAALAATNRYSPEANRACDEVVKLLIERRVSPPSGTGALR